MMLSKQAAAGPLASPSPLRPAALQQPSRRCAVVCPRAHHQDAVEAQALSASSSSSSLAVPRRQLITGVSLLAAAGASGVLIPQPALATGNIMATEYASDKYAIFKGYATPPTSYGGYGGTANEPPKYTFEYPRNWKADIPSKSEKGTKGIDGRVISDKGTKGIAGKGQRAFVITLGRAGEDNKSFVISDLDQTFQGFAAADYDLQDALSIADEIRKEEKQKDGLTFYDFDIDSPVNRYLASISVKLGKVYALFVKSPANDFKKNEGELRHIIDSFKLIDAGYGIGGGPE